LVGGDESDHLEGKAAWVPAPLLLTTSEWMAASRGEAATSTAAVHHVEKDIGVNVDVRAVHASHTAHTTHAAHAAHAAHASHAAEATAAKHVGRVNEVITIVICSTFPVEQLE
jgi:hypothetical protein